MLQSNVGKSSFKFLTKVAFTTPKSVTGIETISCIKNIIIYTYVPYAMHSNLRVRPLSAGDGKAWVLISGPKAVASARKK